MGLMNKLGPYALVSLLITTILVSIYVSVASDVIPDVAVDLHNFTESFEDTAVFGTTGGAIASTVDDNQGSFWVIGLIFMVLLIISSVMGVKLLGSRNKGYRRRYR